MSKVVIHCEWCNELPAAHQIGQDGVPMWLVCRSCLEDLKSKGALKNDED